MLLLVHEPARCERAAGQVPEVHRGDWVGEVGLCVRRENIVGFDLQFAQRCGGHESILNRRIVLVTPRGPVVKLLGETESTKTTDTEQKTRKLSNQNNAPVRVTIPVVVADKVLAASCLVDLFLQGLIDALQQFVSVVRCDADDTRQTLLDTARRHTHHYVQGRTDTAGGSRHVEERE